MTNNTSPRPTPEKAERPWEHPERGSWESDDALLDKMHYRDCHCRTRGFFQCQKARYRIRAAVRRALDKREAAAFVRAAIKCQHEYGNRESCIGKLRAVSSWCLERAAKARAKGKP